VAVTGLPAGIVGYLERHRTQTATVIPLTGDASDRRYFRVITTAGTSFVLALHAQAFAPGSLPFVNVASLFAAVPIPVPAVLGEAPDLGVLALEDLGDLTLQAHLGAVAPEDVARLYAEAVDYLPLLQRRGAALRDERYLPYTLAFDVDKFTWEMNFFVKHFLEAYRGAAIDGAARAALTTELGAIVTTLAAEPRVICHRDYHSRNLMVTPGGLVIIDFQDARLGPDTYDLASLLRDSYVDLPHTLVDGLIDRFRRAIEARGTAAEFLARFDLMAMQRNLKALGTFGYQTVSRANPVYAQYVPRTLRHVRENCERNPRFDRLRTLLATWLPELRA
jgi:aminoglycoside/choline kinase family phosphotransferase